jgi:hypothetical protein
MRRTAHSPCDFDPSRDEKLRLIGSLATWRLTIPIGEQDHLKKARSFWNFEYEMMGREAAILILFTGDFKEPDNRSSQWQGILTIEAVIILKEFAFQNFEGKWIGRFGTRAP